MSKYSLVPCLKTENKSVLTKLSTENCLVQLMLLQLLKKFKKKSDICGTNRCKKKFYASETVNYSNDRKAAKISAHFEPDLMDM